MSRFADQNLAGWGRSTVEPCRVYCPHSVGELNRVFEQRGQRSYISRGLGRSYGDAAINGGSGVILHEKMDRLLAFDPHTGVLEAEAGVSLAVIIEVFLPQGWFVPVTPGTKHVTLGGAIAADVHGKNQHHDGSFGSFVLDFQLLGADGEILTCSAEHHSELFWATIGGMGLTGVLLSARLQMMPVESAYLKVTASRHEELDELFAAMDEHPDDRYSVAWMDGVVSSHFRSVLMRGDHAAAAELPLALANCPFAVKSRRCFTVPPFVPSGLLNSTTVKGFNALYYATHKNRTAVEDYEMFFYPLDGIGNWNRLYGNRGFLQYQLVLPSATSRDGLKQVMGELRRSRRSSFLAVLKSFGPGNDGLLSFPTAGHTLALDLPNDGVSLIQVLHRLDRIVLEHGGRVYLAKDACLSRESFEAMYPRVDAFRKIKKQIDPGALFASSQARRLGLLGPHPDGGDGA